VCAAVDQVVKGKVGLAPRRARRGLLLCCCCLHPAAQVPLLVITPELVWGVSIVLWAPLRGLCHTTHARTISTDGTPDPPSACCCLKTTPSETPTTPTKGPQRLLRRPPARPPRRPARRGAVRQRPQRQPRLLPRQQRGGWGGVCHEHAQVGLWPCCRCCCRAGVERVDATVPTAISDLPERGASPFAPRPSPLNPTPRNTNRRHAGIRRVAILDFDVRPGPPLSALWAGPPLVAFVLGLAPAFVAGLAPVSIIFGVFSALF
jgi:hypothetical protein